MSVNSACFSDLHTVEVTCGHTQAELSQSSTLHTRQARQYDENERKLEAALASRQLRIEDLEAELKSSQREVNLVLQARTQQEKLVRKLQQDLMQLRLSNDVRIVVASEWFHMINGPSVPPRHCLRSAGNWNWQLVTQKRKI
jgi:C4-dicarboxylate-specific signal transduction histidine kinase